jgi:hypothetical protein
MPIDQSRRTFLGAASATVATGWMSTIAEARSVFDRRRAAQIRVVVWDERQPAQKQA